MPDQDAETRRPSQRSGEGVSTTDLAGSRRTEPDIPGASSRVSLNDRCRASLTARVAGARLRPVRSATPIVDRAGRSRLAIPTESRAKARGRLPRRPTTRVEGRSADQPGCTPVPGRRSPRSNRLTCCRSRDCVSFNLGVLSHEVSKVSALVTDIQRRGQSDASDVGNPATYNTRTTWVSA